MLPLCRSHTEYLAHWISGAISMARVRDTRSCSRDCARSTWNRRPPCCAPFYSAGYGSLARPPEEMLRSFVAMILAGVTSIAVWVKMLSKEPFYAVASGFAPVDTPGVGTFYD